MEVKKYENNLEYITELHPIEKRECWTLSDYIKFLQEVEKLGYGQYYLANSDYETGDTWLYNRRGDVGFLALHIKEDKDLEDDCRFSKEESELLELNGRNYCFI